MSLIRWEEPPQQHASQRPRTDWPSIAEQLKARPGEWAVVTEWPSNISMATYINTARYAAFRPAGSFEAAGRVVNGVPTIYARYIGGGAR